MKKTHKLLVAGLLAGMVGASNPMVSAQSTQVEDQVNEMAGKAAREYSREDWKRTMLTITEMTEEEFEKFTDDEYIQTVQWFYDNTPGGDPGMVYQKLKQDYPERFAIQKAKIFVEVEKISEGAKEIKGSTTANATVTILFDKTGDKVTVDADEAGAWSIEVPATVELLAGNQVQVTVTGGEDEVVHQTVTVEAAETTEETTETSQETTEDINHFVIVDKVIEGIKEISGKTTPKATVTVLFDETGDKVTVDANEEGLWSLLVPSNVNLVAGDRGQVTVTSIDDQVLYQEFTVQAPDKVAHFVTLDKIEANDRQITGTTTANATVTVMFERTKDKVTVDADAQGNWSAPVPQDLILAKGDVVNATATSTDDIVAHTQKVVSGKATPLLPQTGEKSQVGIYSMAGLLSLAAAYIGIKSKKV